MRTGSISIGSIKTAARSAVISQHASTHRQSNALHYRIIARDTHAASPATASHCTHRQHRASHPPRRASRHRGTRVLHCDVRPRYRKARSTAPRTGIA
jgi:hypothetical protein